MLVGRPLSLKFLTKLNFNYDICFNVPATVFSPRPKIDSNIVKFNNNNNKINLKKAIIFSNKLFKNKRKKISNKIKLEFLQNDKLMNKRVDELSIDEVLYIYNFF